MMSEDLIYVPGDWLCPKCSYRLHKRILYAESGTVGVDMNSHMEHSEECPNDGTKLVMLTWKQDAEEANRVALDLMKQLRRAEERIYELEPKH